MVLCNAGDWQRAQVISSPPQPDLLLLSPIKLLQLPAHLTKYTPSSLKRPFRLAQVCVHPREYSYEGYRDGRMKETSCLHTSSLYFCFPFLMDEGWGMQLLVSFIFANLPNTKCLCLSHSYIASCRIAGNIRFKTQA